MSPAAIARKRAYDRAWKRRHYQAKTTHGKCGRCSDASLPGYKLCQRCRQYILAFNRKRDVNKPKKHCGACGAAGHNRSTCNARGCLVAERLGVPCRTCAAFMGLCV